MIKKWRNSCGEESWPAVAAIKSLIDKAHGKGIPVIYTTGVRREDNWDSGSWSWKNTRNGEVVRTKTNVDGNQIVDEIAPGPKDIVILKQKPSGFFGTNMASYLTLLGCDSVIVTGTTTSGCVRATVLDAFQQQLSRGAGGGGLLRPLAGEPRHQPLRHEREICRRGEVRRSADVLRYAAIPACTTCRRARSSRRPGW